MVYEMDREQGYDWPRDQWEAELMRRADAADAEPPILHAPQSVVEEWVLVPRALLRRLQQLGQARADISHVQALMLLSELIADARLIGVQADG